MNRRELFTSVSALALTAVVPSFSLGTTNAAIWLRNYLIDARIPIDRTFFMIAADFCDEVRNGGHHV